MTTSHHTLDASTWVDRFGSELFRYAVQRLRNDSDAEDVVQETFLTAWRTRDSYRGDISERNWLYTILKSRIIDSVRRRATRQSFFVEDSSDGDSPFREDGHWHHEPTATAWLERSPEAMDDAERAEFHEIFDRCLQALPEQQRLIFTARELDGLETDEICQIFGITASNLWVVLHRARLRLRDCLNTHWFELPREHR